jgi:hypothetical protein
MRKRFKPGLHLGDVAHAHANILFAFACIDQVSALAHDFHQLLSHLIID